MNFKDKVKEKTESALDIESYKVTDPFIFTDVRYAIHNTIYRITMDTDLFDRDVVKPANSFQFTEVVESVTDEFSEYICQKFNRPFESDRYKEVTTCVNCGNPRKLVFTPVCSTCDLFTNNGLDSDPYFLTDYEDWKRRNKFVTDFFPDYNKLSLDKIGELLKQLINSIGRIIPARELDYSSNPGRHNLQEDAFIKMILYNDYSLINALSRTFSGTWYKAKYGSWFKTLIATNILDSESRETFYGTMTLSLDGHECRSLAEKTIDDWLFMNKIKHSIEPYYPLDSELNPSGLLRADWKVGKYFIEYFGLMSKEEYKNKTVKKIKLCKKNNIKLISLFPEDLLSLGKKLKLLTSNC